MSDEISPPTPEVPIPAEPVRKSRKGMFAVLGAIVVALAVAAYMVFGGGSGTALALSFQEG